MCCGRVSRTRRACVTRSKTFRTACASLRSMTITATCFSSGKGLPDVASKESLEPKRRWAARAFTLVEDFVYLGLGLLLAGSSIALLIGGLITFVQHLI